MIKKILDVCCGAKSFYFDKNTPSVTTLDIRQEVVQLHDRIVSISPNMVADFRALPFEDETFYHVIFDPPHLYRAGCKSFLGVKYGVLNPKTWREDIQKGFSECFRVLKNNGTLVFKWNEYQIPVGEILQLAPTQPIYGHRSGKRSLTHWLVFIKSDNND